MGGLTSRLPAAGQPSDVGRHRFLPSTDHASLPIWLPMAACSLLLVFPSEVAVVGPLGSNGSPIRLLGFLAFIWVGVFVFTQLSSRAARQTKGLVPLTVGGFAAAALISNGISARTAYSVESSVAIRQLLVLLAGSGIALFICFAAQSLREVELLSTCLVAGGVLCAGVGFAQAAGWTTQWATFFQLPGLQLVAPAGSLGSRFGMSRIYGTTSHPIEFSVILATLIPITLHLLLFVYRNAIRVALLGALSLMLITLPLSLSRSGLLCTAAALLVYGLFIGWPARLGLTLGAAGAIGVVFAFFSGVFGSVVDLFAGVSDDPSIQGRLDDYPIIARVLAENPLFGGLPNDVRGVILDNQWLGLIVSGGLVALAAYALLLLIPLLGLLRYTRRSSAGPRERSLAGTLAAGIVASAVASGTLDSFSFQQTALLTFILIGMSGCLLGQALDLSPQPSDTRSPRRLARRCRRRSKTDSEDVGELRSALPDSKSD